MPIKTCIEKANIHLSHDKIRLEITLMSPTLTKSSSALWQTISPSFGKANGEMTIKRIAFGPQNVMARLPDHNATDYNNRLRQRTLQIFQKNLYLKLGKQV